MLANGPNILPIQPEMKYKMWTMICPTIQQDAKQVPSLDIASTTWRKSRTGKEHLFNGGQNDNTDAQLKEKLMVKEELTKK